MLAAVEGEDDLNGRDGAKSSELVDESILPVEE
jgi:hypothetical protein